MFANNHSDSPKEVISYWGDTNARVQDEVNRIGDLMRERHPFTNYPVHFAGGPFNNGCFEFTLPRNADLDFVDLVLNHYKSLGWTAKVKVGTDMGGSYRKLQLSHTLCEFIKQTNAPADNAFPKRRQNGDLGMIDPEDFDPN